MAGIAKGRRLVAPEGREVRPTSDRVREALFSALASLGAVEGAAVVDLFAGTGALGVEALSRGAGHATFVETSEPARRAIVANLAATGLTDRATVVRSDVLRWLRTAGTRADLAFADPPYAFDGWETLLEVLDADLAVLESDRELEVGERWQVLRRKRYGGTVVTIVRSART